MESLDRVTKHHTVMQRRIGHRQAGGRGSYIAVGILPDCKYFTLLDARRRPDCGADLEA